MLRFQSVTENDYRTLAPFIREKQSGLCDATLGTLYFWKDYYHTRYAIQDDILFFSSQLTENDRAFSFFPSPHPERALSLLEEYCQYEKTPLILYPVEEALRPAIAARYHGKAVWTPLRDAFDYLYSAADFVSFAGKAYHRQRNHISKFKKTYPNHAFRPLQTEDFPALRAFYNRYITKAPPEGDTA